MKQKNRESCGVTLLELLLAIAIIALLAALLLSAISRAKLKAQQIKHEMGIALPGFVADGRAYPSGKGGLGGDRDA